MYLLLATCSRCKKSQGIQTGDDDGDFSNPISPSSSGPATMNWQNLVPELEGNEEQLSMVISRFRPIPSKLLLFFIQFDGNIYRFL